MSPRHYTNESGQIALMIAVALMAISLTTIAAFASIGLAEGVSSRTLSNSKQSFYAAESALEYTRYRLENNIATTFPSATHTIGDGTAVVTEVVGKNDKRYISTGSAKNTKRSVAYAYTAAPIPFIYTVMAGTGGLDVRNSTHIWGGRVHVKGYIRSNNSGDHINNAPVEITSAGYFVYPPASAGSTCSPANCNVSLPSVPFPSSPRILTTLAQINALPPCNYRNTSGPSSSASLYLSVTNTSLNQFIGHSEKPACRIYSLNVSNNGVAQFISDVYVSGNVYVLGNIVFESPSATNKCKALAHGGSFILGAYGTVTIKNTCNVTGNGGTSDDYDGPVEFADRKKLLIVSLASGNAIIMQNQAVATVLYALNTNGNVLMYNTTDASAVYAARQVYMQDNANVEYEDRVKTEFTGLPKIMHWRETY